MVPDEHVPTQFELHPEEPGVTEQPFRIRELIWIGVGMVVVMFVISAVAWNLVPAGARIPVQWGADGQVGRYGSKAEGLLLLPVISVFLILLFAFLPKLEPRKANLAKSMKFYKAALVSFYVLMIVIHIFLVLSALGYSIDVGRYVPVLVGAMFLVMGNYLGKVRSNFFMGIRTPWTLSSELSWNRTHRLGAKLFAALGLMMIVLPFLASPWLFFWIFLPSVLIMVVVLFVYSYVIWKHDPDKITLGRRENANGA